MYIFKRELAVGLFCTRLSFVPAQQDASTLKYVEINSFVSHGFNICGKL